MTASLFGTGNATNVNVSGTLVPQKFIASVGQTTFTITNFTYTIGTNSLLVFINGSKQVITKDFVEINSTSFSLVEACLGGEVVEIIGFPEINLTAVTAGSVSFGGGLTLQDLVDTTLVSVKNYPYLAQGDGVTDDTEAFKRALEDASNNLTPTRIIVPKGVYKITDTLIVDAGYNTLDFQNCILDMTEISTYGFKVMSTAAANFDNYPWLIGSGRVIGPNTFAEPTSVGILYQSIVGGIGTQDLFGTSATGLNMYGFGTSVVTGSNAYSNAHYRCKFQLSTLFFSYPAGGVNTGVTWDFYGCQFVNGINGFDVREATANVELYGCGIVTTGGYAFRPEAGYITVNGGYLEVDASTGAQLVYNNNLGGGSISMINIHNMNVLLKNQISKSPVELNSLNTYLNVSGGHWSIAEAAVPGTIPVFTGTGSGSVTTEDLVFDGLISSGTSSLAASILYSVESVTNGNASFAGVVTGKGLISAVPAGGNTFALSGNNANQVTINATPTVLVAENLRTYIWLVRDQTSGGAAFGIYDSNGGLVVLSNTIAATVVFTASAGGLRAATTAGTVTRVLIVLAIRV